jgi:hypothetical protein
VAAQIEQVQDKYYYQHLIKVFNKKKKKKKYKKTEQTLRTSSFSSQNRLIYSVLSRIYNKFKSLLFIHCHMYMLITKTFFSNSCA